MLLQLATSGKAALANISDRQSGFRVHAQTLNGELNQYIQGMLNPNINPSEQDVFDMAQVAGNVRVAKDLFSQYLNYRSECISNFGQMQSSLHNFYSGAARVSAQVNQSQNRMLQSFAQSAYQIGLSNHETKGMASAYANGMNAARGIM